MKCRVSNRAAAAGALVATLAGCQAGYYAHLLHGQYDLLSRREPIAGLIERPDTDAALKSRLERALDARRFASRELLLPDNGSYTQYADLKRPYAVWNVFAAPEFSLTPHEWCYFLAGCFSYRGYYDLDAAREEAAELGAEGLDVHIGGVPAYSTLGWFDDPVLNTVLSTEDSIAGTIFHELAHQKRFVRGDTAFNESFATFVEQEGLRRYLRGSPALAEAAQRRRQREAEFVALMLGARRRLETLYASALPMTEMRPRKQLEFERLSQDYETLREAWGGDPAYDGWMAGKLDNARLLPFGLYHEWVPAFTTLFRAAGEDWQAFYGEVDALAEAEVTERRRQLEELRNQRL